MFFWRKIDSSMRYAITGFGSASKFVLTQVIEGEGEKENGQVNLQLCWEAKYLRQIRMEERYTFSSREVQGHYKTMNLFACFY